MFDLLFGRKKRTEIIKNEKFEKKIDTIEESLSKMENEYFLQLQSTSQNKLMTLDENPDFKSSLDLIQSLGFSNSENLVERNKAVEASNAFNKVIQQACRSLDFVSKTKSYFGENTIVISIKDMISLIKKYDLVCGNFKDYKGIVPDSNAIEINSALEKMSKISNRYCDDPFYETFHYCRSLKIEGIDYYSSIAERRLTKSEEDELNIFPIVLDDIRVGGAYYRGSNDVLRAIHNHLLLRGIDLPNENSISELRTSEPNNGYMFICAPREHMNNANERIKISYVTRTDDPFIFSLSPYGVVIYSMWGKEAEDAMLEKYKNFLRKD